MTGEDRTDVAHGADQRRERHLGHGLEDAEGQGWFRLRRQGFIIPDKMNSKHYTIGINSTFLKGHVNAGYKGLLSKL